MMYLLALVFSIFSFSASAVIGGLKPEVDSKILESTVSIIAEYKGDLRSFCTGSLIAPKIVITAAHCVASILTDKVYISSGINATEGQFTKVITEIRG